MVFRRWLPSVLVLFGMLATALPATAAGDAKLNYADRQALVINNCPFLTLSAFRFANEYRDRGFALVTNLSWKNTGPTGIVAFEVVVAYFDPFNRPISAGGRWLVSGTNSGDWSALDPGETSSDGLIGYRDEDAYTGFAFVRAARLKDGTVWMFDDAAVEAEIQKRLPQINDFSNINPDVAVGEQ